MLGLGDPTRPSQGHQVSKGVDFGSDIIIPKSISQCEPMLIYYNVTMSTPEWYLYFRTPDYQNTILFFTIPKGIGYLDWICNIPSGNSFVVSAEQTTEVALQYYTVQPGSSSACLSSVITTYSYLQYEPNHFRSYTQHSYSGNLCSTFQLSVMAFPTASFPTVTVNPNLAVTTISLALPTSSSFPGFSPSASSLPASSPPVSSASVSLHNSKMATIASGIITGVMLVLFTIVGMFIFRRKRRAESDHASIESKSTDLTGRSALTYLSIPVSDADSEPQTSLNEAREDPPYLTTLGIISHMLYPRERKALADA